MSQADYTVIFYHLGDRLQKMHPRPFEKKEKYVNRLLGEYNR